MKNICDTIFTDEKYLGFPGGAVVKNPAADAGHARDEGLIPGLGRSPREGNGNLLQYSHLRNSFQDKKEMML